MQPLLLRPQSQSCLTRTDWCITVPQLQSCTPCSQGGCPRFLGPNSVYKAESVASNAEVVLKAYNLAGLSVFLRHQVLRELDIHSRLSHSGVVHLMAAFRVRNGTVEVTGAKDKSAAARPGLPIPVRLPCARARRNTGMLSVTRVALPRNLGARR